MAVIQSVNLRNLFHLFPATYILFFFPATLLPLYQCVPVFIPATLLFFFLQQNYFLRHFCSGSL